MTAGRAVTEVDGVVALAVLFVVALLLVLVRVFGFGPRADLIFGSLDCFGSGSPSICCAEDESTPATFMIDSRLRTAIFEAPAFVAAVVVVVVGAAVFCSSFSFIVSATLSLRREATLEVPMVGDDVRLLLALRVSDELLLETTDFFFGAADAEAEAVLMAGIVLVDDVGGAADEADEDRIVRSLTGTAGAADDEAPKSFRSVPAVVAVAAAVGAFGPREVGRMTEADMVDSGVQCSECLGQLRLASLVLV